MRAVRSLGEGPLVVPLLRHADELLQLCRAEKIKNLINRRNFAQLCKLELFSNSSRVTAAPKKGAHTIADSHGYCSSPPSSPVVIRC